VTEGSLSVAKPVFCLKIQHSALKIGGMFDWTHCGGIVETDWRGFLMILAQSFVILAKVVDPEVFFLIGAGIQAHNLLLYCLTPIIKYRTLDSRSRENSGSSIHLKIKSRCSRMTE
jgi:hypothetical protein